jgi:hypothetical protein
LKFIVLNSFSDYNQEVQQAEVNMREFLTDVIKHVNAIGGLQVAKIDSNEKRTILEAMPEDRSVILHARAATPCEELKGIFGLTKFEMLDGFLSFANYRKDDATLTVKYRDPSTGESAPEELVFSDGSGQTSVFRFMSAEHIPDIGKFLGTQWDVKFHPSQAKVNEFLYLAGVMQSHEHQFSPSVVDTDLVFYIGEKDSSNHRVTVTMAHDITARLTDNMFYDLKHIAPIIKLGMEENLELAISARGALMLRMANSYVEYSYIFPGRIR